MRKRQSQNPKRRLAAPDAWSAQQLEALLRRARYIGSAYHKRRPADYGFQPPTNPRPHKSLCDDHRPVPLKEAQRLFMEGVRRGMVSAFQIDGRLKYVWSVDEDDEVYEAKWDQEGYHGYRLDPSNEKHQRAYVLHAWKQR
jgi:hypothetical protein